jgi:hypothetical protein
VSSLSFQCQLFLFVSHPRSASSGSRRFSILRCWFSLHSASFYSSLQDRPEPCSPLRPPSIRGRGAQSVSAESPFWILPLVRSPSELGSLYRCFSRSTPARTAFHFLPVAPDSLRRFWLSSPTRHVFVRARNHVPSFLPPAVVLPRELSLLSSSARLVRDSRFSSRPSTRPAFSLCLDFPSYVSSPRQERWLCSCLVNRVLRPICLGPSVFARTGSCRKVLLSARQLPHVWLECVVLYFCARVVMVL